MFIYVMDEKSANKLIARGYTLLKKDERNNVWCFENTIDTPVSFEFDGACVVSDTLTF